ncbi:hypothetical protein AcW1_000686 [Taiwanofungus camphoratus]|nr:hypothetical protein AcW2_000813 [Antrodia cinnamomea]KAI0961660.1 hypothetical protein AcV7_000705 [Antrodia cinnamomea]KAI0963673.1 hypothetical protein AcW1_000686 [Antrodia cinnamomea]KAI0963674.1 hypothetical protein AcW1_000686 [Antrodia cinnamomea]
MATPHHIGSGGAQLIVLSLTNTSTQFNAYALIHVPRLLRTESLARSRSSKSYGGDVIGAHWATNVAHIISS